MYIYVYIYMYIYIYIYMYIYINMDNVIVNYHKHRKCFLPFPEINTSHLIIILSSSINLTIVQTYSYYLFNLL